MCWLKLKYQLKQCNCNKSRNIKMLDLKYKKSLQRWKSNFELNMKALGLLKLELKSELKIKIEYQSFFFVYYNLERDEIRVLKIKICFK